MRREGAAARTANVGRMAPDGIDEARDATRRTRLANERTYLAWWRSGLTSLAVAFGIGRLIPEVSGGTRWPSVVVGAGFGALGVSFMLLAFERQRRVERALASGGYAPLEPWIAFALTAVGAVLGVSTVLIVVFQS